MIGNLLKLGGYALLAKEAVDIVTQNQYYREKEQCRREAAFSLSGALVGMAVGVGLGILYAPRAGKETREMVVESAGRQFDRLQAGLAEGTRQVGDMARNMGCSEDPREGESGGKAGE